MSKTKFYTGEYYHVYNRGVDKRNIFNDERDYLKFINSAREFNNDLVDCERKALKHSSNNGPTAKFRGRTVMPLVDIICYCLNPNHFHFILRQNVDDGVSGFMKKVGCGYTCYFNKKYSRSGVLFQGRTKAVHIKNNSRLLWLSGYVNGNSEIHQIENTENYIWSSCQDYLGKRNGTLCNKEIIMSQFNDNPDDYKKFMIMVIKESRERKDMRKLLLE